MLGACGASQVADTSAENAPYAVFERMPSGVAVLDERVFLSFPRWVEPGDGTVYELVDGALRPYPSAAANDASAGPDALHSVNGIHIDRRGWLWILDNGRVDLGPAERGVPKLVVWDVRDEREVFRMAFDASIAPLGGSFLNDLVVHEDAGVAVITQSGIGGTPSLIVVEPQRDRATAVLVDDVSVRAARDMVIDGAVVEIVLPTGPRPWRVAANSVALDGDDVLFGPMSSDTLYRVPVRALIDPTLSDEARAAAVEPAMPKPVSDGICVAADGTVMATDVEGDRVVALREDGWEPLAVDPRMSFPVAVECAEDALWLTSNQLHRSPLLRGGEDGRTPPYFLWRIPTR